MSNKLWTAVWAVLMSLAWLIPVHYRPWPGFHQDAWIALIGMFTLYPLLSNGGKVMVVPIFAVVVASLSVVPWIQYATELLIFSSQAWLTSAYLLGFSLAIVVGANLENRFPGLLLDGLFGAILIASIFSVGLSLGFWADVIDANLAYHISMGHAGGRHYANLGQPNLLASLLLLGVIGGLWAYSQKAIGVWTASVVAAFLLAGVVLTASRTAHVAGIALLVLASLYGARFNGIKIWRLCFIFLLFYFASALVFSLLDVYALNRAEEVGYASTYVRTSLQGDLRLTIWRLYVDAILSKPWAGYGWTETLNAQIAVADRHPGVGQVFAQSHNIILDLFVWVGIPFGLVLIFLFVMWLGVAMKKIKSEENFILLMALTVIGVHANFEYPLQYAIFLIPVGFVIGALDTRIEMVGSVRVSKYFVIALSLFAATVFFGIVKDYLRVESSYNKWRYEAAGVKNPKMDVPDVPDVYLLTHFKHWFEIVRIRPHSGMSAKELTFREDVVRTFPSPGAIYELALSYALNEQPQMARQWLNKICKLANATECALLREAWGNQRERNALVGQVVWPIE